MYVTGALQEVAYSVRSCTVNHACGEKRCITCPTRGRLEQAMAPIYLTQPPRSSLLARKQPLGTSSGPSCCIIAYTYSYTDVSDVAVYSIRLHSCIPHGLGHGWAQGRRRPQGLCHDSRLGPGSALGLCQGWATWVCSGSPSGLDRRVHEVGSPVRVRLC